MQGFDAAKATAAYLAQLPPEAHHKAQAYTQGGHWILLGGAVVSILVSWLIIRSGLLSGLRTSLDKTKARPVTTVFLVVVLFNLLGWGFGLPWDIYANWWRETQYGLKSQGLTDWLVEGAISTAISALIMGIAFVIFYALIRKMPKTWWLWSGGVAGILIVIFAMIGPVFIEPIFNKYQPLQSGPVRDTIVQMAKENGVPYDKIYVYNGSKQSNRYTANVSGAFGTTRIAISDSMMKTATLDEVRGVVGHEMGHYVHNHVFWEAGGFAFIIMLQLLFVQLTFEPMRKALGGKAISGIADPAGLPVLMASLTLIGLLMTPVDMTLTRLAEADADDYGLEHARAPDGFASAMVKTIEYRAATPSQLEETLFYDHPSVGSRIRKAMDWKAAHMPAATLPVDPSKNDASGH